MKDEIFFTPFYRSFQKLCQAKGEPPSTVAANAGIASGAPTAWKKGAIPRPEQRERLCKYFNVTDQVLLGYEEKEKSPAPNGTELNAAYYDLTPDNRALIDSMIEKLLKSQSDD